MDFPLFYYINIWYITKIIKELLDKLKNLYIYLYKDKKHEKTYFNRITI